jgi:hypothetical protein
MTRSPTSYLMAADCRCPATGIGRRRIADVFGRLLSFINLDLAWEIDQAERSGFPGGAASSAAFEAADFAVSQLSVANRITLDMLRQAVDSQDVTTLEQAVSTWKMPDSNLVSRAVAEMTGEPAAAQEFTGILSAALTAQERIMQSIVLAQ